MLSLNAGVWPCLLWFAHRLPTSLQHNNELSRPLWSVGIMVTPKQSARKPDGFGGYCVRIKVMLGGPMRDVFSENPHSLKKREMSVTSCRRVMWSKRYGFFSYIHCFFFFLAVIRSLCFKKNLTDAVMFSSLHVLHFYGFQNFSFTALYKLAPQHSLKSFNRRTYESYCNLLSVHAFLLTTNVL